MKKILAGILTVLLLLTMTSYDAMAITTAEKEQSYQNALEELVSFMESPDDPQRSLHGVITTFESLKTFKHSLKLCYYAQALQKILDGEYDALYEFYIDNLVSDEKFCAYLSEESDYPALGTPDNLKTYGEGRKAEMEGDTDAARGFYKSCTGFFDSDIRSEALYVDDLERAYQQAISLMEENKLTEAYSAFSECHRYLDSEALMAFIVKKLGYDPASQTPAPTDAPATASPTTAPTPAAAKVPAFDLILLEKAGYIMFRWQIVEGANSYAIKRHGKNDEYTTVSLTTNTSYRDSSIYPNYIYFYTVTAQFPDGSEVDSKELSVIAERSAQAATAKPTAVPTARPTTTPIYNPTTPPATPRIPNEPMPTSKPTQAAQWGAWSDWSTTPVTASSTRQVETDVREEEVKITKYQYSRWAYTNFSTGMTEYTYAEGAGKYEKTGSGTWEYLKADYPLEQIGTFQGRREFSGTWFNESAYTMKAQQQVTYYRYRDFK